MNPHILDISLFGFYALWIVGLGLLLNKALHRARRAQRVRSRARRAR
jgi:hypothetical protein